jgi:hypothetical protein
MKIMPITKILQVPFQQNKDSLQEKLNIYKESQAALTKENTKGKKVDKYV